MNNVQLMGRLVRDPEVRYSQNSSAYARYTLAVQRRYKTGDNDADYINCVAFGKQAEFADKYLTRAMRVIVCGHIQTGSYTNRSGEKVYTTDVVVESHEFVDSKNKSEAPVEYTKPMHEDTADAPFSRGEEPFMDFPDDLEIDVPFG